MFRLDDAGACDQEKRFVQANLETTQFHANSLFLARGNSASGSLLAGLLTGQRRLDVRLEQR
ncbi:MAG: hypothetical protein J0I29_01655, partial [Rhizobiales bacterium]|nr:hypothetical protein [Hyphomicrobiales bacterium]